MEKCKQIEANMRTAMLATDITKVMVRVRVRVIGLGLYT